MVSAEWVLLRMIGMVTRLVEVPAFVDVTGSGAFD